MLKHDFRSGLLDISVFSIPLCRMNTQQSIDRRDFIKRTSLITGSLCLSPLIATAGKSDQFGKILPTRKLGKTGLDVTLYCVGGHHVGRNDHAFAEASIDRAIELGCRFFDTAEGYQRGESETRFGKFLSPKYREQVQILTKTRARTGEEAETHMKESLERLRTDYIDVYLMHSIDTVEDVDNRLNNGVLEAISNAKKKGIIKHIGFSGHKTPAANNHLINKKLPEIEVMLCPINVVDPSYLSFINDSVPVALENNVGVLAMKSIAGGGLIGVTPVWGRDRMQERESIIPDRLSIKEAHQFALSYPVSSLVAGHDTLEQLEANIATAKNATKLSEEQRMELIARVADIGAEGFHEHYKA